MEAFDFSHHQVFTPSDFVQMQIGELNDFDRLRFRFAGWMDNDVYPERFDSKGIDA